jgi:uncharacterized protein (TIGR02231 family)
VTAVTVYPSGAEVVRQARVSLPAGDHVVMLRDLPAQAVGASLRVEGKAAGRLEIGGVDHKRTFVLREEMASADRRQLEQDIENLRDERQRLEAIGESAELQRNFVRNLTQLPTVVPPPGTGQAPIDWSALFTLIGTRSSEAQAQAIDAQIKIRDVDRRLDDLQRRLASTAPQRTEQTEVRIAVSSQASTEADLTVRYQVTDAGWQPLYDARLETGARNVAPRLTLVRRAALRQRTGEPWVDVALALSTARPTATSSAPELRTVTVDIQQDLPRPAPAMAPPPPAAVLRGGAEDRAAGEGTRKVAEAAPQQAPATEQTATLETGAFSAQFSVKDRLTLPETGETKNVLVDEQTLEPSLVVRAVPRLDPRAYLYARIVMPRTAPYLAGPVSLFRDRTFTGTARLPQLAPGDQHELGFGQDDLVRVRFATAEERRGEGGLITTTRTDERNFRMTIRNLHERPIAFSLMDQVPVSLNQDIKVDLLGRMPPTRRDVDDKRGVLAWEDRLNADEERVIEFGYRLVWPANRSLTYGR